MINCKKIFERYQLRLPAIFQKNICDEFTKMSKIGPSMESLNVDLVSFFSQNDRKLCFE